MANLNELVSLGNGLFGNFSRSLSPRSRDIAGYLDGKEVSIACVWYDKIQEQTVLEETKFLKKLGSNRYIVKFLKYQLRKEHPPVLYLVYELCQTKPLEEIVKLPELSNDTRRKMCLQLALGVKHIHDHGKAHGFLQPRYIFASMDGKNLKIGGYRLKELIEKSTTATSDAESVGYWHSPEIYNGKEVNTKSDVFTLGLIFYFILSNGKQPRDDEVTTAIKKGNVKVDENDLSSSCPLTCKHLLSSMLRKDPSERPSAEEILRHPFLMDDNMRQECVGKLSAFLSDIRKRKTRRVNAELLSLVGGKKQGDKDVLLLLYSHCKVNVDKNVEAPPEIKRMSEIFPGLKNLEIVLRDFDPNEIEFEEGQIGKDIDLEQRMKALQLPSTDNQEPRRNSQSTTTTDNKITVGEVEVGLVPIKEDAWIFYGKRLHSVEKGEVVTKLLTEEHTIQIFEHLKHCHNIVTTRSESKKSQWPIEADTSVFNDPPMPGKEYLWLFMENCSSKTLLEIAKEESHSLETKKKCIIHVLLAVHQLIGEDGGNVVHGNINPRKFLLSEDKRRVKLLGSSGWKFSDDEDERKEDLRSTWRVICALLCNLEFAEVVGKTKDDLLKETEEKLKDEMELPIVIDFMEEMWDSECEKSLSHAWLWSAKTRLDFLTDVAECIDSREIPFPNEEDMEETVICPEDWIEKLRLTESEKDRWYKGNDPEGHIYQKAKKEGAEYQNQRRSAQLLRLIRNKYTHLLSDLAKAETNQSEKQTLFEDRKKVLDFFNFFQIRFPNYFIEVYRLIRKAPAGQEPSFKHNYKNMAHEERLPKPLNASDHQ